MKKILFVTHDISDYGAARSMQEVLLNTDREIHLHVILPLRGTTFSSETLSQKFNIKKENITSSFGFNSDEYLGGPRSRKRKINQTFKEIIFNFFQKKRFYKFLQENSFETVYLNSLTLYPYLSRLEGTEFIIHIRERFISNNHQKMLSAFQNVDKIIFIDESTKNALNIPFPKKTIVLTDPVDMRFVHTKETATKCRQALNRDLSETTVFSMIGKLDFIDKGTGFALENFIKLKSDKILFLIFGTQLPWTNDFDKSKKIVGNDDRVIFMGEISDQSIIYGLTDVVIRAEEVFAVGRTVLEGIRSGCAIVMPGVNENLTTNGLDFAKERIFFYPGRDTEEFKSSLESLVGYKKEKVAKETASTVDQYNLNFFKFILE